MSASKTTTAFRPLQGSTVGALELAIARFERRLRYASRVVAAGDRDLAEDFYQAAIAELWEVDPARFDTDDDGYLWQVMMNRMLKSRRGNEGNPTRPPLALRIP